MKCNICELVFYADEKSKLLLEHLNTAHKDVYDLHKENPEATVGFRIEFLNLNVLKEGECASKEQSIIFEEVCEATTEEIVKPVTEVKAPTVTPHLVVKSIKKKVSRRDSEARRKSWVWKYFERMSNIIYRCQLCGAVLSIKGCNTNNMNRHVRTKHSNVYLHEMAEKKPIDFDAAEESIDNTISIKEEISNMESLDTTEGKTQKQLQKRSWIWLYFDRISGTLAQCKLCQRNICHGGNATGNMNRHLKMIHNKTGPEDHAWIWKVFDQTQDGFACKICQFRCWMLSDHDKNISCILQHLNEEHGVVSGEQIITTTECDDED